MSQSFTNLLYHPVFNEGSAIITLDYQPRLYDYIGGITANWAVYPLE